MTEDRGLWRHHAKIERRLNAEGERISHELDDVIQQMRATIKSVTHDIPVTRTSDSARPALVLVAKRPSSDVPDVLYWSRDGIVACASHAPRPDNPRYRSEDWRQVLDGRWYLQCQACHGTPIRPATRGARSHQ